jgi:predicted Fe-S protein YdhL (DUF1289 family)
MVVSPLFGTNANCYWVCVVVRRRSSGCNGERRKRERRVRWAQIHARQGENTVGAGKRERGGRKGEREGVVSFRSIGSAIGGGASVGEGGRKREDSEELNVGRRREKLPTYLTAGRIEVD